MFTLSGTGPIFLTPISSVQSTIESVFTPLISEAAGMDADGQVAAIGPDGDIFDIPVNPNSIPQIIIEVHDLDDYGADTAMYAGTVDLSEVSWTVADNALKLFRTLDSEGNIVVRMYVDSYYTNSSSGFSGGVYQAAAFAVSENIGDLVSPTSSEWNSRFVSLPTSTGGDRTFGPFITQFEVDYFGLTQYFDMPQ
jgi:hypothetical protein